MNIREFMEERKESFLERNKEYLEKIKGEISKQITDKNFNVTNYNNKLEKLQDKLDNEFHDWVVGSTYYEETTDYVREGIIEILENPINVWRLILKEDSK